jgi:hypothetical protein
VLKRDAVCLFTLAFGASTWSFAACGSNSSNGGRTTSGDASGDGTTADAPTEASPEEEASSPGDAGVPGDGGPSESGTASDGAPSEAGDASPARDATVDAAPSPYLNDAVDLSIGSDMACAIRQSGTVVCWGPAANIVPKEFQLPADAGAVPSRIVVNARTVCILDTQGGVWCLGGNGGGQLGSGAPPDTLLHMTPTPVVDGQGAAIRAVAIGGSFNATCAMRADGSVVCWGLDPDLQLGQPTSTQTEAGLDYSAVALPVPGVSFPGGVLGEGWGSFACAGGEAGITCWGLDTQSETLGGGYPTAFNTGAGTLLSSAGAALPVRQISLGYVNGCVLDAARQIYCWGDNSSFQRGTAQVTSTVNAVTALADAGVSQISCGDGWTCAVDGAGHARCFGGNNAGQLGNGTKGLPEAGIFTVLDVDGGPSLSGVARVFAGGDITCAILGPPGSMAPGPVFCWGYPNDLPGPAGPTGLPEPLLLP